MRRAFPMAVLALALAGCVTIPPSPSASPGSSVVTPTTASPTATPSDPAATSQATPSPVATLCCPETPPPGSGTPGPSIDPALAAQIDEVIAAVPEIRELEPLADVPYEFISREEFRDDLIELNFAEIPEEWRRAEERLLKRIGLLPDDANLDQLIIDLYGAQVAAFYRPDTKRFYIIQRDQPFGASDKLIVAHEYTHALQDQHFDLEGTRIKDLSEGDAILGQLGAIEGDATQSMQLWTMQPGNLTPEEALQVLFESLGQLGDPALANMPPVLRRQLEYPYVEGFSFTQEIYDLGGWEAVNASLSTAIPASTEQVLHPEKYLANEAPVDIEPPDVSAQLGEGWSLTYEQTMGELVIQVWVAGDETPPGTFPGLPVEWPHAETAAGWGGDRLSMYEHPDGRWAIDWELAWDTEADALEFVTRATELVSMFDGVAFIPGSNVILVGSDQATLDALIALR